MPGLLLVSWYQTQYLVFIETTLHYQAYLPSPKLVPSTDTLTFSGPPIRQSKQQQNFHNSLQFLVLMCFCDNFNISKLEFFLLSLSNCHKLHYFHQYPQTLTNVLHAPLFSVNSFLSFFTGLTRYVHNCPRPWVLFPVLSHLLLNTHMSVGK